MDHNATVCVGWREYAGLPQLQIPRLRAKIDTGARTSALHVDAQWRFVEAGAPWIGFQLAPRRGKDRVFEACAAIHDERAVADSSGRRTSRVFIRTPLLLAGIQREVEVNLADRCGMLFPMLIGRSALQTLFTVDPARSFVHGRKTPSPGTS